jgi:hypothetical protein
VRAAQFWTPYPNTWNTAVGFPVHSRAPPLKRRQGMLWGKMTKYFEARGGVGGRPNKRFRGSRVAWFCIRGL